jgi:hypothetical protein
VPRAAVPELLGDQVPRIRHVPAYTTSAASEAVELAAYAGLDLDPWQQGVLTDGLAEDPGGGWAADDIGITVSRQNGKGGLVEARQLAGIYLFGEKLGIYSAHEFKTTQEAFGRLRSLIDSRDDLSRRVVRVVRSTNEMGMELRGGQRVRFMARSRGAGRGFSAECLILDEDMYLTDAHMAAVIPTQAARTNTQTWYFGSAGEEISVVQGRLRRRGLRGEPRLVYLEWSARSKLLGDDVDDDHDDHATWARANPALGIRISLATIERERRQLSAEDFARERLGIGTYPPDEADGVWGVVGKDAWLALADTTSRLEDPVALAVDVTPDQSAATIAAAGQRPDGLYHVEVVDHHPGTAWVVPRLAELVDRHGPIGVVIDRRSPAGALYGEAEAAGVPLEPFGVQELVAACGQWAAAVSQGELRHLDQAELRAAFAGAERRPLGDGAWALARRGVDVDISPAVAAIEALWLYRAVPPPMVFGPDELDALDEDEDQDDVGGRESTW